MDKKRKEEILEYLRTQKFMHEANALKEISHHGSEQYVLYEQEKAALVDEILEIVEFVISGNDVFRPEGTA